MTNTPWAPWIIIEGEDDRYRSLTTGKILLEAIRQRLSDAGKQTTPVAPPIRVNIDGRNLLSELNLTHRLSEKDYEEQLAKWQGKLSELVRDPRFKNRSLVCAFEGADAAGKGGAIRRITAAMDARDYQIIPVAAPTEEERAQPYLWRFWRHIPRNGRVAIFDRTWYGRVLVERVEGYCAEADWLRAYSEINDFEHDLAGAGVIVVKFWLQISQEEQLKRFKEREKIEFKRFKITEEDWRNREKWDPYQEAICDMVDRTSTGTAPWTLVEANDKGYARVKILRTVCERLEAELEGRPVPQSKPDKAPKEGNSVKAGKEKKADKDKKAGKVPPPAPPATPARASRPARKTPARPKAPPAARTVSPRKGKTAT
jgi:polyphosphate:AMP phosphotransferase